MPVAGDNNITAAGENRGSGKRYTPQLRMYFECERHGLLFSTFDLPFLGRHRTRDEAIKVGNEWLKRPNANRAAEAAWDIEQNWRVMGIPGVQVKSRIRETLASA